MRSWIGDLSLKTQVVLGSVGYFFIFTASNVYFEDGGWISSGILSLIFVVIGGYAVYRWQKSKEDATGEKGTADGVDGT